MLKFSKRLLWGLGGLIVIGAALLLFYEYNWANNSLTAVVLVALSKQPGIVNPHLYDSTLHGVIYAAIGAVVGGFLLGLGLGLPSATFRSRLEKTLAKADDEPTDDEAADPSPSKRTKSK